MLVLILILVSTISSTKAGYDCDNPVSSKDPKECCPTPDLYPAEAVEECKTLYAENSLKELIMELPGPKRGCVSFLILEGSSYSLFVSF